MAVHEFSIVTRAFSRFCMVFHLFGYFLHICMAVHECSMLARAFARFCMVFTCWASFYLLVWQFMSFSCWHVRSHGFVCFFHTFDYFLHICTAVHEFSMWARAFSRFCMFFTVLYVFYIFVWQFMDDPCWHVRFQGFVCFRMCD